MTSSRLIVIMVAAVSLTVAACASTGKKNLFNKIYPGMTADQVAKTMERGPDRAEEFEGGYAAWYYGEDQCLLLKKGEVISKQKSEKKSSLKILGMGGYGSKTVAECVPPGYAKEKKVKKTVKTPFGEAEK